MEFNKFIRQARKQSGLTQGKLAQKLGYNTGQFVSNWERGKSYPPADTIKKLNKLLNVDLKEKYLEMRVNLIRSDMA